MAGVGYNIPVSVSLSAGSSADSPFSDDTYVLFSGSTQESYQPITNTPTQATTANSSAAEGNAAANNQTPINSTPADQTGGVASDVAASGFSNTDLILLGSVIFAAFIVVHNKI